MRLGCNTPIDTRSAATALIAVVLGCAQASQPGPGTAPSVAVASGETLFSFVAARAPMRELRTVSFALDRIDQRGLPLDQTYRHAGTGRGVTVYVFDGGILATHPELAGRVRIGYNAFPGDAPICNAHGTAVAGAIAGTSLGVAPEAELVDVKMVNCERLRGTIRGIVDGVHWVIQDHKQHPGPAVANWSFIADTAARIPALDSAVAALRADGIAVVVSAGNVDVNACHVSPGNSGTAIVVGASAIERDSSEAGVTYVDRRSPGTAWGPCVDIYAPGDSVLLPSLDRSDIPTVQLWNGTSMSAGYVSGAVALFLEANPRATPDNVAEYLRFSATTNVVREARSPLTRMLYVGPLGRHAEAPQTLRTVAEVRAELEHRRP